MSEPFSFDDPFFPVPPAAMDVDPAATIRDLLYRVGKLEHTLQEQQLQAQNSLGEVLLYMVSLSDDLKRIVQSWGVATTAQDASLVRNVVALGRKMLQVLRYYRVEPVETVGKEWNADVCEVVEKEYQPGVAEGVVLREVETGYTWEYGMLRRAKVVINATSERAAQAKASVPAANTQTNNEATARVRAE